ncbi:MAG: formate--tetrahydrofolate ligase [Burkholderiaceae bacterium]
MPTDIEIAQAATLLPIASLARDRLGIPDEALEAHGRFKAKLAIDFVQRLIAPGGGTDGRLVLVTAISPTPAGEGKTTTTIGLVDGLNRIERRAIAVLREPSLGPVFGLKGGAAGAGRAQVVPMEEINLHFNGDFSAIGLAHNLLAAMIDNHVQHGNALDLDLRRISWRRVSELSDRALRRVAIGLGGAGNGFPREDGFDIVAASEVMAIVCLADSLEDLKRRLGEIVIGQTRDRRLVRAHELRAHGAMTALLRDAIKPNLVQTLEGTPALVHGGPIANIAHGCNSLIATRTALRLAEFAVTEAGFGADLGAEKFVDIKCRAGGLRPAAAVIVASLRGLKYQGGIDADAAGRPDAAALARGVGNLERHLENVRKRLGIASVVCLNRFPDDTDAEIAALRRHLVGQGVAIVESSHWAHGGAGAEALAREVSRLADGGGRLPKFVYEAQTPLSKKIEEVARRIYRAADVRFSEEAQAQLAQLEADGFGTLPICIAKTPYSFTTDPSNRGAPRGHVLDVRALRVSAGAGFVVVLCGDVLTMPGLPSVPAAEGIDVDAGGRITGLS